MNVFIFKVTPARARRSLRWMTRPATAGERIAERARAFGERPVLRAFREDRIPPGRFPDFLKELFIMARGLQDVLWAATEIEEGPYADFAREHRGRGSGHCRWMRHELWSFGLGAMTEDDWFRFEWLPTRVQIARILARLHGAGPEERLTVLACAVNAGRAALDVLHGYAGRHGLEPKTRFLGRAHLEIEEGHAKRLGREAAALMRSPDARLLETVDLVFDALGEMCDGCGERTYGEFMADGAAYGTATT